MRGRAYIARHAEEPRSFPLEAYGDPEALRQAIGHLPKGQRQALELLELEELSLKEAAAVTGTSPRRPQGSSTPGSRYLATDPDDETRTITDRWPRTVR